MCKHWGLHISTNINHLSTVLGSFWAVWRGLLWCLKAKLRSWRFPRYWRFNKWYHGGYQLICLISRPLRSRKEFGSISEGEPSIGGVKPKVSDFRFRSTACIPVFLCLLCKSCSGLLTGDAKLAYCAVEVCWLIVFCSGLDSTLEINVKFEILKSER